MTTGSPAVFGFGAAVMVSAPLWAGRWWTAAEAPGAPARRAAAMVAVAAREPPLAVMMILPGGLCTGVASVRTHQGLRRCGALSGARTRRDQRSGRSERSI